MLVVADVRPEPALGAAGLLAAEDRHGGVVGPDHRRLQYQVLLQRRQRLEHGGGVADPVAERAPRQIDAVSRQDIFESIERQVIGELADDHEGDQPGPGHAAGRRLGRDRRAGDAVAAPRAGVLGQDVDADLQPGRDELELAGLILADADLGGPAA